MITIKLPIQNEIDVSDYINQWNCVVRFAYNRFQDNPELKLSQVEQLVKSTMKNIDLIDASLIKSACDKAKGIKDEKVIFGGKVNFKQRKYGKIDKETYDKKRNIPVYVRGSTCDSKGNRKFELDVIDNNQIIFKPSKSNHIACHLPKLSKINKKQLHKLQELCENNQGCFTCGITNTHIWISFDEELFKIDPIKRIENRILSIDQNPNYTAFVICDYDKEERINVIHKEIISVKEINSLMKSKYQTNKRKHEMMEISKRICNLANHYQVETIALEQLNMKTSDKGKGRNFNRICNNDWLRKDFMSNLKKRCNINGIKYQEIIPAYTSIDGCIDNAEEYDSIGASFEIGRRANLFIRMFIKKEIEKQTGLIMKHKFEIKSLATRWKKMLGNQLDLVKTYADLWNWLKEKKLTSELRILFDQNKFDGSSFSLKSNKSLVTCFEI